MGAIWPRGLSPGEDVQLMKMMRKVALAFAAAVLGAAAVGISAPAHAQDTNWPHASQSTAAHS